MLLLVRWPIPWVGLCLLGGCTAILGDDFELSSTTTTSVGIGGSEHGGGGSVPTGGGGSGASTQGGGGGAPTGGSGGTGGCALGTANGCDDGSKCTVIDPSDGTLGCVTAGSGSAWSHCQFDTQCVVGTWCDATSGVCRPICNTTECSGGGSCAQAVYSDGLVPNLFVCSSNCEPDQAAPCVQDNGPVTCIRYADGWDCAASNGGGPGDSCSADADCSPGLLCDTDGHCWEWCKIGASGTCTMGYGSDCYGVSPAAYHDGSEYGHCTIG
jgi:hypothetical protein